MFVLMLKEWYNQDAILVFLFKRRQQISLSLDVVNEKLVDVFYKEKAT
jgi:hypothetical protein